MPSPRRADAARQRDDEPSGPLWTRPAEERAPRQRVTREAIVAAAIELADAHGLEAVSIRRVAAALATRPMGLYSHIARKDDLIDLMLDAVIAGALLDEVPDDWQEALRGIARRTRATCLRHPWIAAAVGERSLIGPNGLRHVEQSLAALAPLALDVRRAREVLIAVDTYTIGHVLEQLAEANIRRREGLTAAQWRRSLAGYLDRLAASGDFPHLARVGSQALLSDDDPDRTFETGLEWLLAGIAADLESR